MEALDSTTTPTVTISLERLRELEEAAATAAAVVSTLRARLAKHNNSNLDRLRAYNERVGSEEIAKRAAVRSKECKARNRDAYNAKKREYRHRLREKKEAETAVSAEGVPPPVTPGVGGIHLDADAPGI